MSTYVKINEQIKGPYQDYEIENQFRNGEVNVATPAWRMGMPEWTTVGKLFPNCVPSSPAVPPPLPKAAVTPPPLPESSPAPLEPGPAGNSEDSSVSFEEFKEAHAFVQQFSDGPPLPDYQPDALARLPEMAEGFLDPLRNRLGQTARARLSFYANCVVTKGIQRLRLDLLKGGSLTPSGEEFVARAAAFMAMLEISNWKRRGLNIKGALKFEPGAADNCILFTGERERNGAVECYSHDFLADMRELLLTPPKMFPCLQGRSYVVDSLTLPSPEYLYLYGAWLMDSPRAFGTWPKPEKVGGSEEDFAASRSLLVDDLHDDCGIPLDNEAMRQLSWWIVFPPYGWDMNDGSDYNLMTVFDQISHKQILPMDDALAYLRALLTCQGLEIRNLAARCLMVYRQPPRNSFEASMYQQALTQRDHDYASASMAKYQSQLEKVENTPAWREPCAEEREDWLRQTPPGLSHRTTAENDPDYQAMEKNPPASLEEGIRGLEALLARYPDDWVLKVLLASQLLHGPDLPRGERTLRELIQDPPDCFEGHSRLGTWLKYQPGRKAEAYEIYEDALRRWPWCHQAADACMWMITDDMVTK